jgi:hypothetical protein
LMGIALDSSAGSSYHAANFACLRYLSIDMISENPVSQE